MREELNDTYETFSRLDNPPLVPQELRPPRGSYLVAYEGEQPVAGGGLRHLADGVAEIKRMYVCPEARSRGVARALLVALEEDARSLGYGVVRLDTGPKQVHALALYRCGRLRRRAPVQRQPLRLLLGREAIVLTPSAPGDPVRLGDHAWATCTVAAWLRK